MADIPTQILFFYTEKLSRKIPVKSNSYEYIFGPSMDLLFTAEDKEKGDKITIFIPSWIYNGKVKILYQPKPDSCPETLKDDRRLVAFKELPYFERLKTAWRLGPKMQMSYA